MPAPSKWQQLATSIYSVCNAVLCTTCECVWYRRATLSFQICTEQLWDPLTAISHSRKSCLFMLM